MIAIPVSYSGMARAHSCSRPAIGLGEFFHPSSVQMAPAETYGNTSTASIPMAICEAVADGRIKTGDTLVLVGFGAGLTWGALTAKWSGALREQKVQPRLYHLFARARSSVRRLLRHLEGIIWGRKG